MAPQIRQIKAEISMLQEELQTEGGRFADLTRQKEDSLAALDSVAAEMQAGADIRIQNQDDLFKVTGVPDKIRKQSDVVANALKSLRVQEARLAARVKELEAGNVATTVGLYTSRSQLTHSLKPPGCNP
jgi:chromosome segregation ATPase